ncbi:hypothetical protein JDV02_006641 [Purpureocillium takamizusanense]|uniref:C2H2-type domain-containing protein n=1 Tax=Purpureocillium takamizusanense TaxID=2060973 RepID=A0A9Q8QKN2_9HYPO|nr:uncharacterized protein JDV02_006641 [Purpureocillium takamizusanense]UNI20566.1 hypothetical protein JDV02_006641 [Purpureocillium takamizusanense]
MDPLDSSIREQYFGDEHGLSPSRMTPGSAGNLGHGLYPYAHAPALDAHSLILSANNAGSGSFTQSTGGYAAPTTQVLAYTAHHAPDAFNAFPGSFVHTPMSGSQHYSTAPYQFDGSAPTTSAPSDHGSMPPAAEHGHGAFAHSESNIQTSPSLSDHHPGSVPSDGCAVEIPRNQVSDHACPSCEQAFINDAELKAHKKLCSANFPCLFQFVGCTVTFPHTNEWKRHVKTIHFATKLWVCTQGTCSEDREEPPFPRSKIWDEIQRNLPKNGKRFTRPDSYQDHVKAKHYDLLSGELGRRLRPDNLSKQQVRDLMSREPTKNAVGPLVPDKMHCYAPDCAESFYSSSSGQGGMTDHCDDFLNHMTAVHLRDSAPEPDQHAPRGQWFFDWGFDAGFLKKEPGDKIVMSQPYGKSNNKSRAGGGGSRASPPSRGGPSRRRG